MRKLNFILLDFDPHFMKGMENLLLSFNFSKYFSIHWINGWPRKSHRTNRVQHHRAKIIWRTWTDPNSKSAVKESKMSSSQIK